MMMMTSTRVYSDRRLIQVYFLSLLVGLFSLHSVLSTSAAASSISGTLPRSQSVPRSSSSTYRRRNGHPQPWNPSTYIDEAGFLKGLYVRTPGEWEEEVRLRTVNKLDTPCRIRQVPGDGNCLFHSISLCLCQAVNGTQWNLCSQGGNIPHGGAGVVATQNGEMVSPSLPPPMLEDLYAHSQKLRAAAVACLRDSRRKLFLQGPETLTSAELVEAAADQYSMTADDYCEAMREDSVWGGGPEIVALCNLLQRPIHVYELAVTSHENPPSRRATGCGTEGFVLKRMACFGSPRFDRKQALHILSADSRFPDLRPGEQLASGNHFLAVFPETDNDDECRKRRRKWLRGGDDKSCALATIRDDDDASSIEILLQGSSENRIDEPRFLRRAASKCMRWWAELFVGW